jgi:hypothetical protein
VSTTNRDTKVPVLMQQTASSECEKARAAPD